MLTKSDIAKGITADESGIAIKAHGLTKDYKLYPSLRYQAMDLFGVYRFLPIKRPDFPLFRALDNIDLTVLSGERLGIIGRNGAGKTTLLKLITGLSHPTAGTVQVVGEVRALMSTGVGFHPEFTGLENIRGSLLYSGLTEDECKDAEDEIIEFCELDDFLTQPVKHFSKGMQARLQFACATAIKPEILIIDEVLGAGDAYFSAKSAQRMDRLTKSGCTLLLVSHSMAQVLQFCDRVIWIDGGKIRFEGSARDVVGEYEVYMRNMNEKKLGYVRGGVKDDSKAGQAFKLGSVLAKEKQEDGTDPDNAGEGKKTEVAMASAKASSSGTAAEANQTVNPGGESQKAILSDGQSVFRWPGELGVKLDSLGLYHKGKRVTRIPEEETVEFRFQVRSELDGELSCRYQLTIFTLDNRRVTRISSPVDTLNAKVGELRDVTVKLEPCLLCAGHFYINFVILPGDIQHEGAPGRRHDLVSRFCDFEVFNILDYRAKPVFFHGAEWAMG